MVYICFKVYRKVVYVMRININMPDDLVKKVDERAKQMFVSRSAYISMAMSQKVQSDDLLDVLPEMRAKLNQLAASLHDKKD